MRVLGRSRLGIPWLLMASYVFYGWWHPAYLGLIFYSTLLDYWVVHWMDQCPRSLPTQTLPPNGTSFGDGTLLPLD